MDLIICPNGHPNRPGRSHCVVCKAPLPLPLPPEPDPPAVRAPATSRPPTAPTPNAPPPAAPDATATPSPAGSDANRWLAVFLIVLLMLAIAAVAWLVWPRLSGETATQLVPPAATEPSLPIVAATDAGPTDVGPTDVGSTDAAPTAVPPTEPPPAPVVVADPTATPLPATAAPTDTPPEIATPTIDPRGSELLTHGNLIANGDFSAAWGDAWLRQVSENNGVQAIEVVSLDDGPAPIALRLTKTGTGTTRLQQIIDVPRRATELRFTGALRLAGSAAPDGSEGRVALMLTYMDENDAALGYSVWIDGSQPASTLWGISPLPAFGPQLSPRYALDEAWQTIDIRLQEEFLNRLPGLDADRVRRIGVNLLALASDTCEPSGCPVTLEAADLQFLPTAMQ